MIFNMEKRHTNRLPENFTKQVQGKRRVILFIEDNCTPMLPALFDWLSQNLKEHIVLPEFINRFRNRENET